MRNVLGLLLAASLLSSPAGAAGASRTGKTQNLLRWETSARPAVAALRAQAVVNGIGVNNPVIAELTGEGGVQYFTGLDVSNNTAAPHIVAFFFDGADAATGAILPPITGNIVDPGGVTGQDDAMNGYANAHFDDFLGALRDGSALTQQEYDDGVVGSLLLVFDGTSASGQGSSQARFYSAGCGGTIGVGAKGLEITGNNPVQLVGVFRDTTGEAGVPQLYPNIFLNNVGFNISGGPPTLNGGDITVQLTAYSATHPSPTPVAQTTIGPIGLGQTAVVSRLFGFLGLTNATDDTLLVFAAVIDGDSTIQALGDEVDPTTRDGSSIELSRADF